MQRQYMLVVAAAALSCGIGPMLALDAEPTPRCDRHGRYLEVEPTQFTTSKKQSASLKRLLRK